MTDSIDEAKEREAALDSWAATTGLPARDMTKTAYVEGWLAHARASRPREAPPVAHAKPEACPVAWVALTPEGTHATYHDSPEQAKRCWPNGRVVPLYATTPPSPQGRGDRPGDIEQTHRVIAAMRTGSVPTADPRAPEAGGKAPLYDPLAIKIADHLNWCGYFDDDAEDIAGVYAELHHLLRVFRVTPPAPEAGGAPPVAPEACPRCQHPSAAPSYITGCSGPFHDTPASATAEGGEDTLQSNEPDAVPVRADARTATQAASGNARQSTDRREPGSFTPAPRAAGRGGAEFDVDRAIRFAASNSPGWPLYPDALRVFIADAKACGRGEIAEDDGYSLEDRVAEVRAAEAAGGGAEVTST